MKTGNQQLRVLIVLLYAVIGALFGRGFLGEWPGFSVSGTWYWSGLIAIVFGTLLASPYYVKPTDAIANSLAVLLLLAGWELHGNVPSHQDAGVYWRLGVWTALATLVLGVTAILTKDLTGRWVVVKRIAYDLGGFLGSPGVIYLPVIAVALLVGHYDSPASLVGVLVGLVLILAVKPLERLWDLFSRWLELMPTPAVIGRVLRYIHPNMAELSLTLPRVEPWDTLLGIRGVGDLVTVAMVTETGQSLDGCWVKAWLLETISKPADFFSGVHSAEVGSVFLVPPSLRITEVLSVESAVVWHERNRILGFVGTQTDLDGITIPSARYLPGLRQGRLIYVRVEDKKIYYQITYADIRDEKITDTADERYVQIRAQKLGAWNGQTFTSFPWLPRPNTPLVLEEWQEEPDTTAALGWLPGTNYTVDCDITKLVRHNCAILGVLGSGKSTLAFTLIRKMISAGIKVVVLDITDQYASELTDHYSKKLHERIHDDLMSKTSPKEFSDALISSLHEFLTDYSATLLILNPELYSVTVQEGRSSYNTEVRQLSPVEITRLIAEALLNVCRDLGVTDQARVCLVLEEAHSLIPELRMAASNNDERAAIAAARVVMQGRKYGLGTLIVTQRTASVSKSALNQCNTLFAFRSFDKTTVEFLEPYFGEHYAKSVSSLEDRHAIVYGIAFGTSQPLIIKVQKPVCEQLLTTAEARSAEVAAAEEPGIELDKPDELLDDVDECPLGDDEDVPF